MRVGFIGTGSMGSILIDAFVRSGAVEPENVTVSNRTSMKAELLAARYPGIRVARRNIDAAAGQDVLFLCVKPLEFGNVINEIKASMQPEQVIVSITSPVLLAQLEEWLPCKAAKIIPSITNMMLSGASLCMYGSRITPQDRELLENLMSRISEPIRIEERYTRIVSDISSCGPAFMACLLQHFIDAAVKETGIDRAHATQLACKMLQGTGSLMTDGGLSPEELQARVSVPGGITAEALKLLNSELDGTFNRLIGATHAKYEEDLAKVQRLLTFKP
jgi:competence protein ComER